jgi:hypothetical protein
MKGARSTYIYNYAWGCALARCGANATIKNKSNQKEKRVLVWEVAVVILAPSAGDATSLRRCCWLCRLFFFFFFFFFFPRHLASVVVIVGIVGRVRRDSVRGLASAAVACAQRQPADSGHGLRHPGRGVPARPRNLGRLPAV